MRPRHTAGADGQRRKMPSIGDLEQPQAGRGGAPPARIFPPPPSGSFARPGKYPSRPEVTGTPDCTRGGGFDPGVLEFH